MVGKSGSHERRVCTLVYPKHHFEPEDCVSFIEMEGFADDWRGLRLNDDDLMALQLLIMLRPKGNPVVQGTGGLRKMRFSSPRWRTGKRGAVRVGYVYLEEYRCVLLVVAYSKSESDDLSATEKVLIRKLIRRVEREFDEGVIR